MKDSNGNGGEIKTRARQTVPVVVAVFVVMNLVTGVTTATDSDPSEYHAVEHDDDFTEFNTSVWTAKGDGAYQSSNERVRLSATGNGALQYDAGVPSSENWVIEFNHTAGADSTGVAVQMFADGVGGGASSGYEVVAQANKDFIMLTNLSSGNTLKKVNTGVDTSNHFVVEYDQGTVHVHQDGSHIFSSEIEDVDTSSSGLGVRSWSGASNTRHFVQDATIYSGVKDSDGDGETDDVDPYPYNSPETYNVTADENQTVDAAYLEASNGSFDATLYGVNSTSGERVQLSETSTEVGSTTLSTLDAVPGYDKYQIEVHGNATVESHGLLYVANAGGGVSEETFNQGVDSIIDSIPVVRGLRRGQIALGGLMLVIGSAIWFRVGGGDC